MIDSKCDITDQTHSSCVNVKTILLALDHFPMNARYFNAQQVKWWGPKIEKKALHLHTLKAITA